MSTARPHAISLQIARETRERFVTATEAAIDHLLTKGWTEVEAQPLLVI